MMAFLQDGKGDRSSYRLGFLVWVIGVFVIWAGLSVAAEKLLDIPQTVVEITLIFVLGKAAQKHIEEKP